RGSLPDKPALASRRLALPYDYSTPAWKSERSAQRPDRRDLSKKPAENGLKTQATATTERPSRGRRQQCRAQVEGGWAVGDSPSLGNLYREALGEAHVEVEHVVEIFAAVFGPFAHRADFNQVEHDLAEVAGAIDAPTVE